MKLVIERMKGKISALIESNGVRVSDDLHEELKDIVEKGTVEVNATYPEGSFQRLFWEQQQKAGSVKNSCSMRWHPYFIKWCLYLRHLSGKSYEMLRKTGCIHLPSQRTPRDYTHYTAASVGFSLDVDQQLIDAADLSQELNCYVGLVLDEVHIKEDLVYDKHQGTLIGFTNLGDVNNCLVKFEASVQNEEPQEQLAKSMFVIMVRGLFNKLNFPYAQFACCNITGDLLMTPVWEAISRLERQGFKVLSLTCDGASSNRRLWQLHKEDRKKSKKQITRDPQSDGNAEKDRDDDDTDDTEEELLHKVPNVFASDGPRYIYFFLTHHIY